METIEVASERKHTTLRRISNRLGEALASTTSLPESLDMTGRSTMVVLSSDSAYNLKQIQPVKTWPSSTRGNQFEK